MSDDDGYPYGGMMFAELILQSCLAVAEFRVERVHAEQNEQYKRILAQTIRQDARAFSPDNLGYNADGTLGGTPYYFPMNSPLVEYSER